MNIDNVYGCCSECGTGLIAAWFIEKEYESIDGYQIATGRTRRAVSHLECPICGKRECVDDSFDGPWR